MIALSMKSSCSRKTAITRCLTWPRRRMVRRGRRSALALRPRGQRSPALSAPRVRSFEEIDRLGIDSNGLGNLIGARAEVDFYRVEPPAGYTKRGCRLQKTYR